MMCKKLLLTFVLTLGLVSSAWAQMPVSQDVGGPAIAGTVAYSPGTGFAGSDEWTIQGSGADIWGSWDQFQFVFRPLVGDGEASVRIASMTGVHSWAKAGVMIRETLDGDSKYAGMFLTTANGVGTHWRMDTGGGSSNEMIAGFGAPHWVKIVRTGNIISTFQSFAGEAFWLPAQVIEVPMNETVYIGMCVLSHDNSQLETVVFDAVDLQAPPALNAWNLSPANGAKFQEMTATLSWEAGDTAASHNVYFGTTSPPPLVVNQAETSYIAALEGGTTYYWQIGELEDDGVTEHLGEERSFSTYREGTGSILREVYEGIGGEWVVDMINNLAYPENPTWSDELPSLYSPDLGMDSFGARMIGYLHPATSGDYTFWVAADDGSEVWLSPSENPSDAVRIAEWYRYSGNYDEHPEQMSAPIPLVGGEKYFIMALYKEGGGGDWCGVAWQGPDSPERSDISGYYLSPYVNLNPTSPSPFNGAKVLIDATLSWSAGAAAAASYEVYLGTSSPPEFVGNGNVLTDVTSPGDVVLGVPNDGLMDGDDWGWPAGEPPALAIDDNTGTKFLHFRGDLMPSGIQVTPAVGSSVVTGLTFTTANDAAERDPITYQLSGSNVSIDGPYELIAEGDIVDFAQADAWPRFTMNATEIAFENAVAYTHYQVMFPTIRDSASANSMQIAEIELLSDKKPSTGYDAGLLEDGTTYYWQIVAVEADGTTKHAGNEWSFSTYRQGTGSILREVWDGIGGTAVTDLTNNANYPANPSYSGELTTFESPSNIYDNYGQRVHGWLHPETSGDYTFWIATDDGSNLLLSTDDNPANTQVIAQESSWSGIRDWHDDESMSAPISLVGGEQYYISALQKEGGGGDNLAVAWEGPDSPSRTIIDGYYLSPFVNLYPWNPSPGNGATITGLSTTLSWSAPEGGADSYDVYVNGELLGSTAETSIDVDGLVLGETYHPSTYNWQVDAIIGGEAMSSVWSFSVTNNLVVDDFDAYDDLAAPVAPDDAGLLVDLRAGDLEDGEGVTTWPNRGSLGDFAANGAPVVEDVDGVKTVTFDGESWFDGPTSTESIEGAGDRTITVLAYNPEMVGEETMVSWATRGGPDGTNMSFNYSDNSSWGAVGHWGGTDMGWWGKNSPAPAAGKWWHLTYTYDGTADRLYVNGAEENYNEAVLNTHAGHIIRVGAQSNCAGDAPSGCHKFVGSIAEVRIYDYALSEGEVVYLAGAVAENPLADTWSESGFVNASGGTGTMEVETFALPGMPYYLGEVSRTLPIDLTEGGAKALSVWFRGNEGNTAEFMYASLSGGGSSGIVLYDGDADDLANPDWQEWNIDMRDFGNADVADEIAIGILGLDGSSDGDVMNFDDIRVYTGRCMPGMLKPEADITNDCRVNMADAEAIVASWGIEVGAWASKWISDEDILTSSASYDAGTETWTLEGHGHDIWDNADDFMYAYTLMSGDCEISARVVELAGNSTHAWSKAGVMIRETLDEGSKFAGESMTGGEGGGAGLQWRQGTNGGCGWSGITEPVVAPPYYVRLVRTGNLIEGFQSADGVTWDKETDITVDMGENVYVGLALTSHESGVTRTAIFDNVNIVGDPGVPAADINDDGAVDWADFFILLDGWLDEQLWPY